ncbi:FlgD immunoglobulin-like domain containing protein [Streptomyces sp. DH24]|uniref:FlgD immunoglobulin-like domain containing protein n=1 Tax=Streptomyces sp. DH24 TaxID=3040123 RepID=UPI00244171F0|nr:FlgD immunoglobulin-like domain containing protein [Streptomyces sp. DH24]MDG9719945.1 FlgD immunoglobulin-like domain containing protein [Streptomyces sp. DH24]
MTVALAATGGALPTFLTAAHAETAPTTLTIDAPDRYLPRGYNLESAGATGDLARVELDTGDGVGGYGAFGGYRWNPVSGDALPVGQDPVSSAERIGGHGSDIVAVHTPADRSVELKDMKVGTSDRFTLPEGQTYHGTYGDSVLTATWTSGGSVDTLHLLRLRDGQLTDTPVTGENGVKPASTKVLGAGDGMLAILVSGDQTGSVGLVDRASGRITGVLKGSWGSGHTQVAVSASHVGWFDPAYGDQKVHLLRRDALGGAETTVAVASSYEQRAHIALVGDWVLSLREPKSYGNSDAPKDRGEPLLAAPVGGGDMRTLLPHARLGRAYGLNPTPDGGVLVAGGTSAGDWAVRKVSARAGGDLAVDAVRSVPAKPGSYGAVTLAAGDLAVQETDTNYLPSLYKRHLELGGEAPSAGPRSLVAEPPRSTDGTGGAAGTGAVALGDGTFAYPKGSGIEVRSGADDAVTVTAPGGGRIVDASGRYVVFGRGYVSGFGQYEQYVLDLARPGDDKVLLTRPASAAAVWGSTFWTPGTAKGTVTATDLKSGGTETFSLGKECTPTDLQAVGRWVYWTCDASGDPAGSGVWDRATKRMLDVPKGGELGDGWVVLHDEAAGRLQLLDFHTADAVRTRTLAELTGYLSPDHVAVDRFGGGVAYVPGRGKPGAMRAVAPGVPASPLAAIESAPETSLDFQSSDTRWDGAWQLSRPAAPGARVVIRDVAGTVVRTLDATQRGAALTAAWDGRTADGRHAHNGTYVWELTAAPKDGQGPELRLTGKVAVSGSAPGALGGR